MIKIATFLVKIGKETFVEVRKPLFIEGEDVTWIEEAPKTWHMIHASRLTVIKSWWQSGNPSEYAKKFDLLFMPGWCYELSFDNESYYDPPIYNCRITVHEMWLRKFNHGT